MTRQSGFVVAFGPVRLGPVAVRISKIRFQFDCARVVGSCPIPIAFGPSQFTAVVVNLNQIGLKLDRSVVISKRAG